MNCHAESRSSVCENCIYNTVPAVSNAVYFTYISSRQQWHELEPMLKHINVTMYRDIYD